MEKSECKNDWMQLNCPKKCGICKGTRKHELYSVKIILKQKSNREETECFRPNEKRVARLFFLNGVKNEPYCEQL